MFSDEATEKIRIAMQHAKTCGWHNDDPTTDIVDLIVDGSTYEMPYETFTHLMSVVDFDGWSRQRRSN